MSKVDQQSGSVERISRVDKWSGSVFCDNPSVYIVTPQSALSHFMLN